MTKTNKKISLPQTYNHQHQSVLFCRSSHQCEVMLSMQPTNFSCNMLKIQEKAIEEDHVCNLKAVSKYAFIFYINTSDLRGSTREKNLGLQYLSHKHSNKYLLTVIGK